MRSAAGFALPAAIFSLVVVGVLVTGGFFLAQQESRIGVASQNASRSLYIAEEGMNQVVLGWAAQGYTGLPNWGSATMTGTTSDGSWTAEVLKTSPRTFFVRTSGTVTDGGPMLAGANHEIGMFYRVILPDIAPPAALATTGNLTVSGNAEVQGMDSEPAGWGGLCGPSEDKPGILINDEDNVDENGGALEIDGDPPIQEDPNMTSDDLLDFGDLDWDDLAAMASPHVFPGNPNVNSIQPDSIDTGSGYACDRTDKYNWGDPTNPGSACFNHFPIIYAGQGLHLSGSGRGQGILLVDGELRMTGGFEFYGIAIVRGAFVTQGTGGKINGGVVAASTEFDPDGAVAGNAVITNSSCAAERAVMNNSALSRPKPMNRRSWVDMTALSY